MARFALIAQKRHRFADRVIAEMRGHAFPDGTVPFWEAVTSNFIPVEFAVVDTNSTVSKQFIEEMMPQHPIYLNLLPPSVQQHIGDVHEETRPALALLKNEGFQETGEVDIFDAGPVINCETDKIAAVERTKEVTVSGVENRIDAESPQVILASSKDGFTSVLTRVRDSDDSVQIDRQDADALGIETGSVCHLLPIRGR